MGNGLICQQSKHYSPKLAAHINISVLLSYVVDFMENGGGDSCSGLLGIQKRLPLFDFQMDIEPSHRLHDIFKS